MSDEKEIIGCGCGGCLICVFGWIAILAFVGYSIKFIWGIVT